MAWGFSACGDLRDDVWSYGLKGAWNVWHVPPEWILSILVAYGIALWGAIRDRRGDGLNFDELRRAILAKCSRASHSSESVSALSPFGSPGAAQRWGLQRQYGWIMPVAMGVFATVFVLLWVFGQDTHDTVEELCFLLVLCPTWGGFALATIMGTGRAMRRERGLDLFAATLPVTERSTAWAYLIVGLRSLLAAVAIGAAALLAYSLLLRALGHEIELDKGLAGFRNVLHPWRLFTFLLSTWCLFALPLSVCLTGRPRLIGGVFLGIVVLFFGNILLAAMGAHVWTDFWVTNSWLLALAILGLAGWVFLAAHRRRVIRWPGAAGCLAAWLILSIGRRQPSLPRPRLRSLGDDSPSVHCHPKRRPPSPG